MSNRKKGRIGKERHLLVIELLCAGHSAATIGRWLEVAAETVRKFAVRRGLTVPVDPPLSGEAHPCWGGGTVLDRAGYELRRVPADGPFGYLIRALGKERNHGYAPTHRIVMHETLGHPLQAGWVVDHIDGDRLNNDPSNLRVFQSNAEHLRCTLAGRRPNWTPEGKARMTGRPKRRPASSDAP